MGNYVTDVTIKAIDQASKAFDAVSHSVRRVQTQLKNAKLDASMKALQKSYQQTALSVKNAMNTAIPAIAVVGTAVVGAGVAFAKTAMTYENFLAQLTTTEGSAEGAKKAFDWVKKFAMKTPYDLEQVTASYVRLRAYGLNPTNGLLQTLGNTAAAMGKPIMASIEMIADAIVGENERLKEFGITARKNKSDKTTTYNYTNSKGVQSSKTVKTDDRKGIENTLKGIFDEKFDGSMDRMSKTMSGILSNLGDQWQAFQSLVMQSGVFDNLKKTLEDIQGNLSSLFQTGEINDFVKPMAEIFNTVFNTLVQIGQILAPYIKPTLEVISAIISGVSKAIVDIVKDYQPLFDMVGRMLAPLIGNKSLIEGISYWITRILVWVAEIVLGPGKILKPLQAIFGWLPKILGFLGKFGLSISKTIIPHLDKVVGVIKTAWDWLSKLLNPGTRTVGVIVRQRFNAVAAKDDAPGTYFTRNKGLQTPNIPPAFFPLLNNYGAGKPQKVGVSININQEGRAKVTSIENSNPKIVSLNLGTMRT